MNKDELVKTLKENRLWAKKALGQNFLISRKTLDKIIEAAKIISDDTIVEIGPGLGVLTEELGRHAKLVLAIEKDYQFVEYLRRRFKNYKNIKIIHDDILRLAIGDMRLANYKVVANLPYNIASPVIRKFLENSSSQLESMTLMVQKEVAERICAKPEDSNRGVLTVMVEFYAQPEIIEIVDKSCFWPVPSVDSAIIKLKIKNEKLKTTTKNSKIDPKIFFRIVKAGFSQKRRQIHHPLQSNLHLEKPAIYDILKKAKINPMLRAEDLNLEDWMGLYRVVTD